MKYANENPRDSKISQALREPMDAPDVTDFVMAQLPVVRSSVGLRWVWTCAAACVLLALGIYLLRPAQPNRIANTVLERKVPEVVQQTLMPKLPIRTQIAAVPEKHARHRSLHRKSVRLGNLPKKQESELLPVPERIDQPEQSGGTESLDAMMQAALAESVARQMKQSVRTLPPNPDADKIERPPLTVIRNNGPERTPVTQPGG